ncbi:carbohydrate ABC transporter permease [Paenibacillus hamazuiensis]|uniref:carbohydrate ABC transporter permease n=1 Tax=Paenibacillus hamazuiensis TaxID=2936508 RepID=UPI00200D0B35|nr:carbohydrate ABC transporter permease [Paenibacillus hamazuiensis]
MKALETLTGWIIYGFVILFTLACFIPFWMILIDSFATEHSLSTQGYQLFPTEFSLDAYKYLFSGKQVFRSYGVTVTVTVIGTALAVLISSAYAYALAHPRVKYRSIMSFLTYFTMIFGTGLVGFYLLIANWLGLKDSIWALILPYLLNPFYTFILVSFYRTIPYELNEAATVEGANDIFIFFKIAWPLAIPAIACNSLFNALHYWNDWWLALLFIDDTKLHPLQIMIRQMISNINAQAYIAGDTSYTAVIPAYGVQLATVCVTIGPILLFYPFIQKYFVKGLTIGAVKG